MDALQMIVGALLTTNSANCMASAALTAVTSTLVIIYATSFMLLSVL
jgi:hypothetical protein